MWFGKNLEDQNYSHIHGKKHDLNFCQTPKNSFWGALSGTLNP